MGIKTVPPDSCSLWLLVILKAQRLLLWDNWRDERGCDEGHWHAHTKGLPWGLPEVVGTVQVHCSRSRLFRRGLEFHMCTINKSVHTKKKSGNLFNDPRWYSIFSSKYIWLNNTNSSLLLILSWISSTLRKSRLILGCHKFKKTPYFSKILYKKTVWPDYNHSVEMLKIPSIWPKFHLWIPEKNVRKILIENNSKKKINQQKTPNSRSSLHKDWQTLFKQDRFRM